MNRAHRVLLVDLNNFARYPTLSIGYMAAVLRAANMSVSVFSPLMVGVGGVTREVRPHRFSLLMAKLNHHAATSRIDGVRRWRDRLAASRASEITAHHDAVVQGFTEALSRHRPEVVLISTYLMYRSVCERLCALCKQQGIPVVMGGPYFSQPEIIDDWAAIDGLSALAAGEVELALPAILHAVLNGQDPSVHSGVVVAHAAAGTRGAMAPPLKELDAVPFPDYSDFPWAAYPNRIVPIITGRGCGWGVCTFCSDVTSTAGRTYRSRSPDNVLSEIATHHRGHGVSRFVFTDLKLNSNVDMWRRLAVGMQDAVPQGQWIGAVHVGPEPDNGLSAADLQAAANAGCVRLTTGLETGSQRIADLMKKGTRRGAVSDFLHHATAAGISTRCTMVIGYPGETAQDVHLSAEFLEQHERVIERVSLNRLQVITGTALHRRLREQPGRHGSFKIVQEDARQARVDHRYDEVETAPHRQAVMRLLTAAHRINRKDMNPRAREFEGVM
ncbi:MAG: B12-binding domain-containing radical SAM protein [Cytophagales bacterium]|nr:B12-binding domain-containing radical SAM protein [Rhizobacter sp.]